MSPGGEAWRYKLTIYERDVGRDGLLRNDDRSGTLCERDGVLMRDLRV